MCVHVVKSYVLGLCSHAAASKLLCILALSKVKTNSLINKIMY